MKSFFLISLIVILFSVPFVASPSTSSQLNLNVKDLCLHKPSLSVPVEVRVNVSEPESFYQELQDDVAAAPYDPEDYQLYRFDCTNIAALLHDHLEGLGYDAKVVLLVSPSRSYEENHALLLVGNASVSKEGNRAHISLDEDSYLVEHTKVVSDETYLVNGSFSRVLVYEDYRNTVWPDSEFHYYFYLRGE